MFIILWHQSPALENVKEFHIMCQFSVNVIKNDFLVCEIDLLNVLLCQHYLQHSQTVAVKNPGTMLSPNEL